ncbi:MAG: MBL fold metallo-hydrolase [Eubacterium sp.]|nr:MBL fold metallo-hydrolase [Eubacterium sp.]
MNYQMTQISSNTWAVQDQNVRFFILTGDERALLIDSGISGLDVRQIAREVTDLPLMLLNTHADPDHIAVNSAFDEFYMHPSEAIVYHNLHHGNGTLKPVYEGTQIDLGGRVLEIIHVPGHTPGSITVLDLAGRCLYGGDPVQENGEIYMFGVHRDLEAYILGLQHLQEYGEKFDMIYPSHADMPVSKKMIVKLIEGARAILSGASVPYEEVDRHGMQVRAYDLGFDRILYQS